MQPVAPEARRFMMFQQRTLLVTACIALLAAALVGFLLARHLSRPVVALHDSVQSLTAGDYTVRTPVRGDDEIASLARHINRLAETLQANESARRRWTADVAHELRTPITILQAEIEAARDGVRPNLENTLDSLDEEVKHLSGLVNDLQVLALADAGALNMQLAEVDLVALLRQVVDALQERFRQAGLLVEIKAPDHLWIQADAQRLRQLLLNLLENSCRYTDTGGLVRVEIRTSPKAAELLIADSKPGLEKAQREQLFERFYRAENSRGRAGGGSGLGLAICRQIVLAHGGSITAGASELGGLELVVSLPRAI
jgi:two-component system sensor histidine kinase BaeS